MSRKSPKIYLLEFWLVEIWANEFMDWLLLFKQHRLKLQNSDRRSRANVLRAFQQRVGLYIKFRAGYRREAATRLKPRLG